MTEFHPRDDPLLVISSPTITESCRFLRIFMRAKPLSYVGNVNGFMIVISLKRGESCCCGFSNHSDPFANEHLKISFFMGIERLAHFELVQNINMAKVSILCPLVIFVLGPISNPYKRHTLSLTIVKIFYASSALLCLEQVQEIFTYMTKVGKLC